MDVTKEQCLPRQCTVCKVLRQIRDFDNNDNEVVICRDCNVPSVTAFQSEMCNTVFSTTDLCRDCGDPVTNGGLCTSCSFQCQHYKDTSVQLSDGFCRVINCNKSVRVCEDCESFLCGECQTDQSVDYCNVCWRLTLSITCCICGRRFCKNNCMEMVNVCDNTYCIECISDYW